MAKITTIEALDLGQILLLLLPSLRALSLTGTFYFPFRCKGNIFFLHTLRSFAANATDGALY